MPDSGSVTPEDRSVITFQLRRRPRDVTGVAVRCPFGRPAVIETAPILSDGTPNPTLLYLTCPTFVSAVSRVEAAGGVRRLRSGYVEREPARSCIDRLADVYRTRRATLASGAVGHEARLEAGIGGPVNPEQATCLHAYAAALLAVRSGWLDGVVHEAERTWSEFYPPVEQNWCRDERCAAALVAQRRAVVDAGTISVRLLVADVHSVHVDTLLREAEITRLGEGLRSGAELSPAAVERTVRAVTRFVEEARRLEADAILVAGTSAVREAADGRGFLRGLADDLGVSVVTLSGREEAEFSYAGASLEVSGDPVVIDIGGGSTELSRRRGIRFETVSLDLGASRGTERWIASDPPKAREVESVKIEARALLEAHRSRFGVAGNERWRRSPARLVGVAGTVTTVASLAQGLNDFDSAAIHLSTLSVDEIRLQLDRLARMTTSERARLACVQAGRAPVIVAGVAILLAAVETLGFREMVVSERDLLDGLALQDPR